MLEASNAEAFALLKQGEIPELGLACIALKGVAPLAGYSQCADELAKYGAEPIDPFGPNTQKKEATGLLSQACNVCPVLAIAIRKVINR